MNKQTILVVEDNELNLKLFNDILCINNFNVLSSKDGFDVFNILTKNNVNLILMDIQLNEISGIDIIKNIKSETKFSNIPIIAVTAFVMHEDIQRIINSGCDGYISKPVTINKFICKITEVLENHAKSQNNQYVVEEV